MNGHQSHCKLLVLLGNERDKGVKFITVNPKQANEISTGLLTQTRYILCLAGYIFIQASEILESVTVQLRFNTVFGLCGL